MGNHCGLAYLVKFKKEERGRGSKNVQFAVILALELKKMDD